MAHEHAAEVTRLVSLRGHAAIDFAALRILEALLFSSAEPLSEGQIMAVMPDDADLPELLFALKSHYANRGVNLICVGGKWAFRTATDVAPHLTSQRRDNKRLSRAALETLSIIAYHQPVTRAEIEAIRGVSLSRGTLEVLLEAGWIKLRGRRRTPGRPVTFGTTTSFLDHFGLEAVSDLPNVEELKAAGLFSEQPVDAPRLAPLDEPGPAPDEDAIEEGADIMELIAEVVPARVGRRREDARE